MFEERQNFDLKDREKYIDSYMQEIIVNRIAKFAAFENEIHNLNLSISKNLENNKTLTTTMDVLKKESKEKKDKYIKELVDLEKKKKALDTLFTKLVTQRIKPTLYNGSVLVKPHDVNYVFDSEETLILAKDSRSKMNEKQNDPICKEKKVNIKPIGYKSLNDLYKYFVPQKQLSAKQAFWLPILKPVSETLVVQPVPVTSSIPRELPTKSLVKKSFQKLKIHLDNFDKVVKVRSKLKAKESSISKIIAHIATLKGKSVSNNNVSVNNANVIAPGMFRLDLEPLSLKLKKNKEAHVHYLQETKEHTILLHRNVGQARALNPINDHLDYACKFITRIQELLVYVPHTCPGSQIESTKLVAVTPMNKNRKVRFQEPSPSSSNIQKQVDSRKTQDTNKPLLPSIGVISSTSASRSKPRSNIKKNKISQAASSNKKNKTVKVYPRNVKSSSNKMNHLFMCNASTKHAVKNVNSKFVYSTCNECLFNASHDICVVDYLNVVNARARAKSKKVRKNAWKPTGKVFINVRHRWLPTRSTFTIYGTKCPLTRITSTTVVPPKETSQTHDLGPLTTWNPTKIGDLMFQILHLLVVSNAGHTDRPLVPGLGLLEAHDWIALSAHQFYPECYNFQGCGGVRHNLFSVGQFCDSDLEVAFWKHICFVCNLEGIDILIGSRDTNLYTLSLDDMLESSPGKAKKHTHKLKFEGFIQEKLYLLHMDLCIPMRIESINGKKYILVIVDDYSR
ncbi:hypothetical protein Tco_1091626, partial [Tanacetum coccineum]